MGLLPGQVTPKQLAGYYEVPTRLAQGSLVWHRSPSTWETEEGESWVQSQPFSFELYRGGACVRPGTVAASQTAVVLTSAPPVNFYTSNLSDTLSAPFPELVDSRGKMRQLNSHEPLLPLHFFPAPANSWVTWARGTQKS